MAPGSPASRWFEDPPAADGSKVVITDTDHYAPGKGDGLWAWKSFLRGHHQILMDFGLIDGATPSGNPGYGQFEAARYAMGDTLHFARRIGLAEMEPRGDLSSTGYALAKPGEEYLVLQPSETADPFTVTLDAGTYTVEWFSVTSRETQEGGTVTAASEGSSSFTAPFVQAGPKVLYLKRRDG